MITKGGETYVNARMAAIHLGISRQWFYETYLSHLQAHKFGKLKRKYYAIADLDALRDSEEVIEAVAA